MYTFPEAIAQIVPGYVPSAAVPASPSRSRVPPHSRFGISCAADEPNTPRISKEILLRNTSLLHKNLEKQDCVLVKIIDDKLVAFCRGNSQWTLVNLGVIGFCSYHADKGCVDDEGRSLAWPSGFRPICVIGETLGDAIVIGQLQGNDHVGMCRISSWARDQTAPVVIITTVPYQPETIWNAFGEAKPVNLEVRFDQAYCEFAQVIVSK